MSPHQLGFATFGADPGPCDHCRRCGHLRWSHDPGCLYRPPGCTAACGCAEFVDPVSRRELTTS